MEKLEKQFTDLVAVNRWNDLVEWDRYYRGDFDLASLPSTNHSAVAKEYDDLLNRADLPICSLVVSAVVERLKVEGFREGSDELTNSMLWEWFQKSKLDARQQMLYADAMVYGDGFLSVTPGGDVPLFRVESPMNLSVEYNPQDPMLIKRAAKVVGDYGWLYTEDVIYSFKYSRETITGWTLTGALEHTGGSTPIVRFPNRIDSRGRSMSEIQLVASIQRRIIQTTADRLLVQRAAAWKQRYVSGISVDTDADGNAVSPWNIGVDQLIVSEDVDTKFGEFGASSFKEHLEAVDLDIRQAAAVTQTPPHLIAPSAISNISAEALVALEAGLASKVKDRQLTWGEAFEEALRIGGRMVGQEISYDTETVWADLESRSDAQRVDAALKLRSMGLPLPFLLERIGLSPQTSDRVMASVRQEQQLAADISASSFGLGAGQGPLDENA